MFARDLVYKYTCHCDQVYIGETKRRLAVRVKEHCHDKKSSIYAHVMNCYFSRNAEPRESTEILEYVTGTPPVDPTRFTIVARGLRGHDSRKRYESLYIKYYDRRALTVNTQKSSRPLALY